MENNKFFVVERNVVVAQMTVQMSSEMIKVESSLMYLGVCFSGEANLHSYVKGGLGEALKSFGALEKKMSFIRTVSLIAKIELKERMSMMFVAETLSM